MLRLGPIPQEDMIGDYDFLDVEVVEVVEEEADTGMIGDYDFLDVGVVEEEADTGKVVKRKSPVVAGIVPVDSWNKLSGRGSSSIFNMANFGERRIFEKFPPSPDVLVGPTPSTTCDFNAIFAGLETLNPISAKENVQQRLNVLFQRVLREASGASGHHVREQDRLKTVLHVCRHVLELAPALLEEDHKNRNPHSPRSRSPGPSSPKGGGGRFPLAALQRLRRLSLLSGADGATTSKAAPGGVRSSSSSSSDEEDRSAGEENDTSVEKIVRLFVDAACRSVENCR